LYTVSPCYSYKALKFKETTTIAAISNKKTHTTMAQGNGKLGKANKSAASQKKRSVTKKKLGKGRKEYATKGRKGERARDVKEATKAINKKNEALASAKAIGSGTCFFLSELKEAGKSELKKQHQQRNKKEENAHKLTDRIKDQLRKLGRDVV
jgi:hypothetical protein